MKVHSNFSTLFYKYFPLALIILGVGGIVASIGVDLVAFGGRPGFGMKQMILLFIGVASVVFGIVFELPVGQRLIDRFMSFIKTREPSIQPKTIMEILRLSMIIAVWFGLVTGFTESFFLFIRKNALGAIIHMSHDYVWMTPLAYLILFIFFGIAVFFLSVLWKRLANVKIYTFTYSFIGLMGLYYAWKRIAFYAAILLSAGIAIQLSIFLGSRSVTFYRFVKASTPWMLLLLGVIMVAMLGFYA